MAEAAVDFEDGAGDEAGGDQEEDGVGDVFGGADAAGEQAVADALEDGLAGATIGMECSGRVTAVGASVTGFEIGDTVMAIGPAAFSTHVRVDAKGVAKLPGSISCIRSRSAGSMSE